MKEGLRARDIEKKWSQGGDGVLDATGEEVIHCISSVLPNAAAVFHIFRKTGARDLLGLCDDKGDEGLVVVGFSCALADLCLLSLGCKPLCSQTSKNNSAGH